VDAAWEIYLMEPRFWLYICWEVADIILEVEELVLEFQEPTLEELMDPDLEPLELKFILNLSIFLVVFLLFILFKFGY
jgi:hypothetical protein